MGRCINPFWGEAERRGVLGDILKNDIFKNQAMDIKTTVIGHLGHGR